MSELVVGILGFACIVALVVTLFKSKTMPSMAFIIFPSILALILVVGGYYSIEQIGDLIKGGFKSTGPTAALFVFSVLFFGIMTDAGMFDVIINKLMKHVGDNVIGVTVMTALIALIGHLDGGGASTFLIVQFNEALLRCKLTHTAGAVLKGLWQWNRMNVVIHCFCEANLVFEIEFHT